MWVAVPRKHEFPSQKIEIVPAEGGMLCSITFHTNPLKFSYRLVIGIPSNKRGMDFGLLLNIFMIGQKHMLCTEIADSMESSPLPQAGNRNQRVL